MCRFLAYSGAPVFLEDLVAAPCHSLIHQSLHAAEAKTGTNGDGFGFFTGEFFLLCSHFGGLFFLECGSFFFAHVGGLLFTHG